MKQIEKDERREPRDESIQTLNSQPSTLNPRSGFSLVELLVVITIIVILVSILGATLSYMGAQAKEAATNATIKKIHVLLEQRTEAFGRAMDKIEKSSRSDPAYQAAAATVRARLRTQSVTATGEPLRILIRKELKRSNFPQTFADAGITMAPAGHVAVTESSEMLYRMLTQGEVGGAAPVDAGEFLSSEVGDTDGDGLIEFIDAWGNPLRFYRWPTRLFKHDGVTHNEVEAGLLVQGLPDHVGNDLLDTDPDDPAEQLAPIIIALPATSSSPTAPPEPGSFEDLYHLPYTYHVPLIVSAGADGELGLFEPNDTANYGRWAHTNTGNIGALNDDISNRNQRSGN